MSKRGSGKTLPTYHGKGVKGNSRLSNLRTATKDVYRVLEENGWNDGYVFTGDTARDVYGDAGVVPSGVHVLFLKPTHVLSLKQQIPTYNSKNFIYTREGEKLLWRSSSPPSTPSPSPSPTPPRSHNKLPSSVAEPVALSDTENAAENTVEITLTPPFSTYNPAEKQSLEGFPIVPYPYILLHTIWMWGRASTPPSSASPTSVASPSLQPQEPDLRRQIINMLHFLDSNPGLIRPIFFDKMLKAASEPIVRKFREVAPGWVEVWRGLGFRIDEGERQRQVMRNRVMSGGVSLGLASSAKPPAAGNGSANSSAPTPRAVVTSQAPATLANGAGPGPGPGRGGSGGRTVGTGRLRLPVHESRVPPSLPYGSFPQGQPAVAGPSSLSLLQFPPSSPIRTKYPNGTIAQFPYDRGGHGRNRGHGRGNPSITEGSTTTTGNGRDKVNAKPTPDGWKKRNPKKMSQYEIRYEAARTTVGVLEGLGFRCALFGSMAAKLYGNGRVPGDIDLLVLPPSSGPYSDVTQEDIKLLLAENCPPESHYVRLRSRDPEATYRVLYWIPKAKGEGEKWEEEAEAEAVIGAGREAVEGVKEDEEAIEEQGEDAEDVVDELVEAVEGLGIFYDEDTPKEAVAGASTSTDQTKPSTNGNQPRKRTRPSHFKSSKVDILLPGIMNLPSLPPTLITYRGRVPCVPYPLLLAQKLQGWSDHKESEEERYQKKVPEDVKDLEWLVGVGGGEGLERNWRGWGGGELTNGYANPNWNANQRGSWAGEEGRIWSDRRMFSEEFEALTTERVRRICEEHEGMRAGWRRVGFEV